MADRDDPEVRLIWEEFHRAVNMNSGELRAWLLTDASDEEGFPPDPDLGVRGLGRQVLHVLGKRKGDLTREDLEAMRKVVLYVEDMTADPQEDDEWRHALMAVGHDPLKG
jgi:hypothetical protein